jgi:serine/threonine protein kinase
MPVIPRLEQGARHSAHATATAAERACAVWAQISAGAAAFNQERARAFDQLLPALVGIGSGGDGCADWAEVHVNLRLPPDLPPAAATAWLQEHAPACNIAVLGGTAAWAGPRTTPLHRALARAIRAQGGTAEGARRFVIEPEGAFDLVKVLDFGIARVHSADDPLGGGPHVFGTPEYMSPEAARGQVVDARADIYSLGLIFYEMLTGAVPFEASSPLGVLAKHIGEPPPPPTPIAPEAEITPAAERLILSILVY